MKSKGQEFEEIVAAILAELKFFDIQKEVKVGKGRRIDLVAKRKDASIRTYAFEVKFYKSQIVPYTTTLSACYQLADYMRKSADQFNFDAGVVVTSSYIANSVVKEIFQDTGINVWDRSFLYSWISFDLDLVSRLDTLFLETNQIVDEVPIEEGRLGRGEKVDEKDRLKSGVITGKPKEKRGEQICKDLRIIESGTGWRQFEEKCIEALKYLFDDDLSLWEAQNTTDDDLSRFDLICRISSRNDFWTSLSRYFNTRYVLFEFKNYTEPIKQGQIYTTEKYLYTNALRSVGFIIARNGADDNALKAAKGALREHGKLLQVIDLNDLCIMLEMRDNDEDPNDYLADRLDRLLIELGR